MTHKLKLLGFLLISFGCGGKKVWIETIYVDGKQTSERVVRCEQYSDGQLIYDSLIYPNEAGYSVSRYTGGNLAWQLIMVAGDADYFQYSTNESGEVTKTKMWSKTDTVELTYVHLPRSDDTDSEITWMLKGSDTVGLQTRSYQDTLLMEDLLVKFENGEERIAWRYEYLYQDGLKVMQKVTTPPAVQVDSIVYQYDEHDKLMRSMHYYRMEGYPASLSSEKHYYWQGSEIFKTTQLSFIENKETVLEIFNRSW